MAQNRDLSEKSSEVILRGLPHDIANENSSFCLKNTSSFIKIYTSYLVLDQIKFLDIKRIWVHKNSNLANQKPDNWLNSKQTWTSLILTWIFSSRFATYSVRFDWSEPIFDLTRVDLNRLYQNLTNINQKLKKHLPFLRIICRHIENKIVIFGLSVLFLVKVLSVRIVCRVYIQ